MFGLVGSRLVRRVREQFFKAVLRMEIGWFDVDANTSGALAVRLASDAPAVWVMVADTLAVILQNIVMLRVACVAAFVNCWRMTVVVTSMLPLLAFAMYMQWRFLAGALPVKALP
jgi:ABC-type multidrug transport system fused ATPase/permease subunit